MPSSTSSSEPQTLRYIVWLLAALVVGQALLQLGANRILQRYGKNEVRWEAERAAASSLVHDGKGVLIIGSSVLLGIDPELLQSELPDWKIRRMVMVGTAYTDWEFALRRLFREGVKPDYVLLPPVPFQIYSDAYRGDYLPLHWLDRRDIPALSHQRNLDLTSISNLYFASYNSFFALRDDFRNAFLGNLIPGHKVLTAGAPNRRTYKNAELDQLIGDRLAALQAVVAENGARLIILRYPAPDTEASWQTVKRIAEDNHVPYFSALDTMAPSEFEDPLHLNPEGTQRFTKALGPALAAELSHVSTPAP